MRNKITPKSVPYHPDNRGTGQVTTAAASLTVDFSFSGICVGSPTFFKADNTFPGAGVVETWEWEFGERNLSADKDPVHVFPASGDFPVILTIKYDNVSVGSVTHLVTIKKSFLYQIFHFLHPIVITIQYSLPISRLKVAVSLAEHGILEMVLRLLLLSHREIQIPNTIFPIQELSEVNLKVMNTICAKTQTH